MDQLQEPEKTLNARGMVEERVGHVPAQPLSASLFALVWLGLLAAAVVVRALVYFRVEDVLHGEEAIQGLMARHILGGAVQLFTYGCSCLGTFQAHLIALSFQVFGSTAAVLKWTAGVESLALVVANYLLAREIAGGERRAGLIAALLTAIGPLYLIEWSLRPRGGHVEVATLSALAFWALLRAFRAGAGEEAGGGFSRLGTPQHNEGTKGTKETKEKPEQAGDLVPQLRFAVLRWLALWAFLLGLGWWIHLTMFYAMAASLVALIAWRRRLRIGLGGAAVAGVCFLAGSLPFWLYNVKYPGRTFAWAINAWRVGGEGPGILDRLLHTVTVSAPILVGSRQTEAAGSFGWLFVLLSVVAVALVVGAAIAAIRRSAGEASIGAGHEASGSAPSREGVLLLVAFSAIALAVFVMGPFGDQIKDPRALLPLYGALPPLAAVGLNALWAGGAARRRTAIFALVALGVVHVGGYRRADRAVIQPRVQGQAVPTNLEPLRFSLEANEITRIYTNFYIGYRLAFETGEQVIACTDNDPEPERYPPYAETVRAAGQSVGYVVGSHTAEWMAADLKKRGIGFSETPVQDFHLFYRLTAPYPQYPPGPQVCAAAEIAVGQYERESQPNNVFFVKVTVTNRSSMTWPPPPSWRAVRLSYHLLDPLTGRMIRYEYPRVPLAAELKPGEAITVTLEVEAPARPGRYAFVPDLIIEDVAWFSALQSDLAEKPNWHEFSVVPGR